MFPYRKGRVSFCWRLITGATLLSFLIAATHPALAQSQKEDVVYLKNGSVVRGVISVLIPESHIAIKKADGSSFGFEMSEVRKISKKVTRNNVVFLKNGNVVKGGIFDIVLSSHIAIVLPDGNISVIYLSQVKKISEKTLSSEFGSPKALPNEKKMSDGMIDGEVFAERIRTGGKFGLGIGIGVLSGLVGTGIGYFVVGPDPMSREAFERYNSGNYDYKSGFKAGWDKKTRSKKRGSFLRGGLIGAVISALIVLNAQNN